MTDEERAEQLARAIEELIQGGDPADLDEEELRELLEIARIRLDWGHASARAGIEQEGEVWRQLLERLAELHTDQAVDPAASLPSPKESSDLDETDPLKLNELRDVVNLRRRMAEQSAALAEAHRDEVWREVQSRLQSRSEKSPFARLLGFFRRRPAEPRAERVLAAVDGLVLGQPIWEKDDSRVDELVELAHSRRIAGRAAATAAASFQGRLWARIRPRLLARLMAPARPRAFNLRLFAPAWPRLLAVGATVALVVAALGPIPATGLAGHPAAQAVRFAGGHFGVFETGSPPPAALPSAQVIEGNNVSAAEAAALLGAPVREPTYLPTDFRPVSSTYFPRAVTAAEGGVLLLTYAADGSAEILVYQERASGSDLAVQKGFALGVTLSDGTLATYFQGSWLASGRDIVWGDDATQTLVFERDGLRTIIQYRSGAQIDPGSLIAVGDGMAIAGPGSP